MANPSSRLALDTRQSRTLRLWSQLQSIQRLFSQVLEIDTISYNKDSTSTLTPVALAHHLFVPSIILQIVLRSSAKAQNDCDSSQACAPSKLLLLTFRQCIQTAFHFQCSFLHVLEPCRSQQSSRVSGTTTRASERLSPGLRPPIMQD